ncbi:MAG: SAM-dependent methyltransferase [Hyphomicrobiales bacterium]|nr:SAM-dependent methyltransferase [Hyphomicrobiales bacterium]
MNLLGEELASIIAQEGPISVERYMSICLGHPTMGYYTAHDPFGSGGDFVTSPEISQMFGELVGLWAAEAWTLCGGPQPSRLAELGPGRGLLMADALRALRVAKSFFSTLEVTMVETSRKLVAEQQARLIGVGRPVAWVDNIEKLPPAPAIVLANEFFDALPVRHYVKTDRGWCERQVGFVDGRFVFGAAPDPEPYLKADAPVGSIVEVCAMAQRMMTRLAVDVVTHGGALLVIDYGHTETVLGETLQAMRHHAFVDPLENPGEADLTAHVDFAALGRAARAAGARVHGPVTQGAFLNQIGIGRRAEALTRKATLAQQIEINASLKRLTSEAAPTDMGALFKVMAVTRRDVETLPGFLELENA